jgi:hypothetical protein
VPDEPVTVGQSTSATGDPGASDAAADRGSAAASSGSWPQPPPPPWRLLPPPPPPGAWLAAVPPAAPGAVPAWAVRRPSILLAPGRRPFAGLAAVAGVAAVLLLPGLVTALVVPGADRADAIGLPGAAFGVGPVAFALAAVLAAGAAVATGVRWLRAAGRRTGAASVDALLAAVPERAGGPPGGIASARRSTRVAALGALAGAATLGIGEAAWQAASDPVILQVGGIAAAAGAVAIVLAAAVVPSILRAVERREVVAAPAPGDPRRAWIPARRSPAAAVSAAAILLGVMLATVAAPGAGSPVACGLTDPWECRAIRVPVDHFVPDRRQDTLAVTYAVHPARAPSGPRRVLVIVTGGPGASGLVDGQWMTEALDPRITRAFDVVTFDARGVGLTDGRDCPGAAREYNQAPTDARTAKTLVDRCIREAGAEGVDLHRYATLQTVEDVDAIRARLGVERITLYGSSYGTVVAQAYAAAHPDHLDGLVLDAPIDRQLPAASRRSA